MFYTNILFMMSLFSSPFFLIFSFFFLPSFYIYYYFVLFYFFGILFSHFRCHQKETHSIYAFKFFILYSLDFFGFLFIFSLYFYFFFMYLYISLYFLIFSFFSFKRFAVNVWWYTNIWCQINIAVESISLKCEIRWLKVCYYGEIFTSLWIAVCVCLVTYVLL